MLADGTTVHAKENVETISIRCIEPGHNDVAVNLFSYHSIERSEPITAHVEVTALGRRGDRGQRCAARNRRMNSSAVIVITLLLPPSRQSFQAKSTLPSARRRRRLLVMAMR